MKLTRCENKHFYDADKYDLCPHCQKKLGKVDLFQKEVPKNPPKETKTVSLMEEFAAEDIADDSEMKTMEIGEFQEESQEKSRESSSLQSQINAVIAQEPTEDVKTMAFYGTAGTEPVVGWLVCLKGEYVGQSFNLKAGQNFIGRALTMDIPLAQDTSVSRNRHAILIYDPQNREFFIQPGESKGLTYLNDKLIFNYQPLEGYDRIKVGNSELLFIPCCGEKFTWEDYL